MRETITPKNYAMNYREAIQRMFAEMKRANEKMERDQEEIDLLKAETLEILARLRAA